MVVELGESEVLKGQVTEALDGIVGGKALFADLVEELAKRLGIHRCRHYYYCRLPGTVRGLVTAGGTGEDRGELADEVQGRA
jgi:hypothetical protein